MKSVDHPKRKSPSQVRMNSILLWQRSPTMECDVFDGVPT
jgi:hypothetical protein